MPRFHAGSIPTIPAPVRAIARNAIWTYGKATAALRPLPDFLIVGAQKAGTTALYAYLREHPRITGPAWKEISYFDRHYARGERWYRGNFPRRRDGMIVGEASPSYLLHPDAPRRVHALVPDARLIVLVREPGARAYSHYQHEVALGREPLSFVDALRAERERTDGEVERMLGDASYFSHAWWNWTYLARGRYAEQLERWLAVFPREQLLVLGTNELNADGYARVLEFLGAREHTLRDYPRVFDRTYEPMGRAAREFLDEHYAEPNRRLGELLGREPDW